MVTPKTRKANEGLSISSDDNTVLVNDSEGRTNKERHGNEVDDDGREDGKVAAYEDDRKTTGLYDQKCDEELQEDAILLQGLSQDSFQHSMVGEDMLVRQGRQVQN